jgi:IS30 family transposase
MGKYHRLTRVERYQMDALLQSGHSLRHVSRVLRRAPSTISREKIRNLGVLDPNYSARGAHERAVRCRANKRPRVRKIQGDLKKYIEEKLNDDWSPEQIAGRLELQSSRRSKAPVSALTIYRHVYSEALHDSRSTLYLHLRRRHKRRKKQHRIGLNTLRLHELKNRNTVSIANRPKVVDRRKRAGDYERDLIRGSETKGFVLTVVDRASRFTRLAQLPEKTAQATHEATVRLLSEAGSIRSLTNDNGSEFFEHEKTSKALAAPIYFAHPYCSWERGTVENTNGLIRQYLPKSMSFEQITPGLLLSIEHKLNSRPRKCLGFHTPFEANDALQAKRRVALAV